MELLVHEPATLAFPPPAEGFRRHGAWVRGPWRLWVDARAIDPRVHVVSFERRVWRARDGEPPALLHEEPRGRDGVRAALGDDGDALLLEGRGVVHHPVTGAPCGVEVPGAEWCLPRAVFHDGAVVRAGDGRGARLVFVGFDGRTRELEQGDPDRLDHATPVRGGRWLCWLSYGREGVRAVRVLDLSASDGPRDLPCEGRHLAPDLVVGDRLLAHEGTTVRLLALDGGPHHTLHAPHEVVAVHPRRVLCRVGGHSGSGQHLAVWDPARPTERRRVWLPPDPGDAWSGDEPPVRVEPDRFVVAGARGYEPIPLDPPAGPAPGRLRALVGPTLDALRARRAALLAARDAPGACPEGWLALLSAGDGCWLLDDPDVALHEELAVAAPDPNVAGLAIRRLGVFGGEEARAALLRVLARTTDHGRRRDLFDALASAGVAEDAAAIVASDPTPGIVAAAARTLGALGDPGAAPWLEARRRLRFPMREQTDETRAAVDEARARLRDRPAALAAWRSLSP